MLGNLKYFRFAIVCTAVRYGTQHSVYFFSKARTKINMMESKKSKKEKLADAWNPLCKTLNTCHHVPSRASAPSLMLVDFSQKTGHREKSGSKILSSEMLKIEYAYRGKSIGNVFRPLKKKPPHAKKKKQKNPPLL